MKQKIDRLNEIACTLYILAVISSFTCVIEPLLYREPTNEMYNVWVLTTVLVIWSGVEYVKEREQLALKNGIELNRVTPLWGTVILFFSFGFFVLVRYPIVHIVGVIAFTAGLCVARRRLIKEFVVPVP